MSESLDSPVQAGLNTKNESGRLPMATQVASGSAKPKIGDSRPAPGSRLSVVDSPTPPSTGEATIATSGKQAGQVAKRRRRGGRGRGTRPNETARSGSNQIVGTTSGQMEEANEDTRLSRGRSSADKSRNGNAKKFANEADGPALAQRRRSGQGNDGAGESSPSLPSLPRRRSDRARSGVSSSDGTRRQARERNGRPVGRYLMCVHVRPGATQIAVLEGRALIEHHVARAIDDVNQIDGNIYRGRVTNVLPGMEAAFVDIGTPKNAVLYWGDVHVLRDDSIERDVTVSRIEHLLRPGQSIVCQVTKNPIGLKGARLTEEVSLPGRFVVLVPGSDACGISKRLADNERKRLRRLVDDIRPEGHGVIVRTAAEGVTDVELRADIEQLMEKWREIESKARHLPAPTLLYSEPHLALRVIREELTEEFRGVIIDDRELFELVRSYVTDIDPALADRVEYYDQSAEGLPIFERHHVHEQLHKALDRKVWLASGGSLIIERTEALTVIDVNTGKNVGSSSLEETVFKNNLEAADEIARQLRLRDIGGIIVIDFIDMEVKANRQGVLMALRDALSRDKTPTQAFEISDLGLVEMTRKRVGEGLVESLSQVCPECNGRGLVLSDLEK